MFIIVIVIVGSASTFAIVAPWLAIILGLSITTSEAKPGMVNRLTSEAYCYHNQDEYREVLAIAKQQVKLRGEKFILEIRDDLLRKYNIKALNEGDLVKVLKGELSIETDPNRIHSIVEVSLINTPNKLCYVDRHALELPLYEWWKHVYNFKSLP